MFPGDLIVLSICCCNFLEVCQPAHYAIPENFKLSQENFISENFERPWNITALLKYNFWKKIGVQFHEAYLVLGSP